MNIAVVAVTAGSGFLFVALAAFVASVRPCTRANLAFAGYAGSYGLYFVVLGVSQAFVPGGREDMPWPPVVLLAASVWMISPALAVLAAYAPMPLAPHERRLAVPSILVGVAVAAAIAPTFASGSSSLWPYAVSAGIALAIATIHGVTVLFTLRFHAAEPADQRQRSLTALLASSLLLQEGMWAGEGILADPGGRPAYAVVIAANVAMAATWLWITHRGGGVTARLVAWTALASVLAGMLVATMLQTYSEIAFSLSRVVASVLIAYAILKHQLLDIDVKVRWGLSRSTVAAVFIAVFFVVSEAAQQFFGETTGSQYLGIAAAGALVFAIVPLQRAAERIAEKAVPVTTQVSHDPASGAGAHEDRYRAAIRLAIRDRVLTRDEERTLTLLALGLGIPAERAYVILDDEAHGGRHDASAPEVPP